MTRTVAIASVFTISGLALGWALFANNGPLRETGASLSGLAAPSLAQAEEKEQPVSPINVSQRPRDTYYPNTEDLKPDEMRVIACGTGMP
ncbi:MAG: hypothetical protein AAF405_01220, partial [Pseudomonadota bacterium]